MPESIEIQPVRGPLDAAIRPPGSKSLTNRALICAALADGPSRLTGVLDSEDTRVMIAALQALGLTVVHDPRTKSLEIVGCRGHIPALAADLYIANSGTTVRFLTAMLALGQGDYRLHGTPRMHQRPIQDLLDALQQLGVDVTSEAGTGCPPIRLRAAGLRQSTARVRGDVSSQFLSALLMVAPYAASQSAEQETKVRIDIDGTLVSKPYIEMTVAVMRAFGCMVDHDLNLARFDVTKGHYQARAYEIEPDASAASYFWAAAAITGGTVQVQGLNRNSLQGDVRFCDCLEQMGCQVIDKPDGTTVIGGALRGVDVDMNGISDTVQTLAVVAMFAKGPTTIRNVGHIRHKETDRIGALVTELRKLGPAVEELPDGLRITPAANYHGAAIDTYEDHRMAMSVALAGLRIPGVTIRDPGCTGKTYPEFFHDLARVCGQG